ncbi:MAG: hypothetical protein QMC36_04915 [Patescibacteria group bacterium]
MSVRLTESEAIAAAATIRNDPEMAHVLQCLKEMAEKYESQGIPAWLTQSVFNESLRASEFNTAVNRSLASG